MRRPRLLLVSLLITTAGGLAACGGSGPPEDWRATDALGATVTIPPDLERDPAERTTDGRPAAWSDKTGAATVTLHRIAGKLDSFATLDDLSKEVFDAVRRGGEDENEAAVSGADESATVQRQLTSPDGRRVEEAALAARRGGDTWVVSAAVPGDSDVDPAEVVATLRLR